MAKKVRRHRASFLAWMNSIGVQPNEMGNVHNYGGGRAYNKPPSVGVCSIAWGFRRRILKVTWDLNVLPCSFDPNATIRFGNLRSQTLEEIFSGPAYRDFIKTHLENRLGDYPVCLACERYFNF